MDQNVKIDALIVHHVGSHHANEGMEASKEWMDTIEPALHEALANWLVSMLDGEQKFQFTENSTMCQLIQNPSNEKSHWIDMSVELAHHLYQCSSQPRIKAGYLVVARFSDLVVEEERVHGLALCKLESTSGFVQIRKDEKNWKLHYLRGIDLKRIEKSALIIQPDRGHSARILAHDRFDEGGARYWFEEFLDCIPVADEYAYTNEYIDYTKNYLKKRLPDLIESDPLAVSGYLDRSKQYFSGSQQFNARDYAGQVFPEKELSDDFLDYRDEYQGSRLAKMGDDFAISDRAVQKKGRVFRSVLKLDKNFHIYVHGDRTKIERGEDADGRKYYKLYYDKES